MKETICAALRSLHVQMLVITINTRTARPENEGQDFWFQAELVAQRATTDIPTLKYVKLDIRLRPDLLSYWTVTRDESEKQLHRVQSDPEISQIDQMFLPVSQLKVSSFHEPSWS